MRGARRTAADEAIGYWGQKIVLAAQDMELNTCWCALCSRKKSRAVVAPGKKIRLIIAVGHGKTQGFSRKTKSVEALSSVRMCEGAGVVCGGHGSRAAGTYGDE